MLSGETDSRSSDPEPEVVLQGLARLFRGQQRRLQLVCSARVSSPSEDKTSGPLSALSITAEKSTADLRSGSESEVNLSEILTGMGMGLLCSTANLLAGCWV